MLGFGHDGIQAPPHLRRAAGGSHLSREIHHDLRDLAVDHSPLRGHVPDRGFGRHGDEGGVAQRHESEIHETDARHYCRPGVDRLADSIE